MEWYDFGIFAFLVPTLSEVFFPAGGTSSLLATFAIGLLPSYDTIGVWTPHPALGGAVGAGVLHRRRVRRAMTYLGEHAPDARRGFLGSWLEFGTLGAYVLGAAVVTGITALLSEQALISEGWRIPFLIAGP